MTDEDLVQLRDVAKRIPSQRRVGVFAPPLEGGYKIFREFKVLPRWHWKLDRPVRSRFDLLVACNVFKYAPDPERWFRNALASCRYLLFVDLVRRRRSSGSEFGGDGDRMRYGIGDIRPRVAEQFDLASLGDRLLGSRTYYGGADGQDRDPLHVVAVLRGDLSDPVLRIDDYPTGIRPILPDLSPLHAILQKVEDTGIRYYLGIVPALLDDGMVRFLATLRNMVPAVHGFDHAYPRYAPLLRRVDPYNHRTVGVFNEFKGHTYAEIVTKLEQGRRLLEDKLGKPVETYIPACNIGDRRTGRALVEAGYQRYLSEKPIPGCPLPWTASDFYGRSSECDVARDPDVVTLHVTWEWDLERQGMTHDLDRFLEQLSRRKAQRTIERARCLELLR